MIPSKNYFYRLGKKIFKGIPAYFYKSGLKYGLIGINQTKPSELKINCIIKSAFRHNLVDIMIRKTPPNSHITKKLII